MSVLCLGYADATRQDALRYYVTTLLRDFNTAHLAVGIPPRMARGSLNQLLTHLQSQYEGQLNLLSAQYDTGRFNKSKLGAAHHCMQAQASSSKG